PEGEPIPAEGVVVTDVSGNGNDLVRVDLPNASPEAMIWADASAANMPGDGSIRIFGNNDTQIGAYLRTVEDAMLNDFTFEDGYTVEAFILLPEDWSGEVNRWTGILSRQGTGGDAGKTESDLNEAIGHLAVSNFPEFQWAVWPTNLESIQTNWSDQLALGEWYHVAIINEDGSTIMYVNGEQVLRNPSETSFGIDTAGLPWTIGGTHYANEPNSFHGWIGDIRVVARPIGFDEFLTAGN
ncbi:MAG: LamG domain-containing protein, partial [Chloroflexi bacterium]|nr:LamG domain-containing protein [Chloroflexota bacterium]